MSTRQARSSSIPIPSASSPVRSIDELISLPFNHPRARLPSAARRTSQARASSSSFASGSSPGRPTPRSFSASLSLSSTATAVFEPRIVRADGTVRSPDHAFVTSSNNIAIQPSRTRTLSTSGASRSPVSQRHPVVSHTNIVQPTLAYVRPAYLDHSSLRHLFHDEALQSSQARDCTESAEPTHTSFARGHFSQSPSLDSDDEGSASPPPPRDTHPQPVAPVMTMETPVLILPTRWSNQIRSTLLSVSSDGRDLNYQGTPIPPNDKKEAAAARTHYPIPPACGIYYFEVEILNKGNKGHISIGFAGPDVKLTRLPGSEKHSWGFHIDDGFVFAAEKEGSSFGPVLTGGDVIGCGIDFSQHKAFYTKNGQYLGAVFDGIGKDVDIYPSVGLRHNGEAVRANFGQDPFKYDIDYYVQQQQSRIWTKVLATPIDLTRLDDTSKNILDGSSEQIREEKIATEDDLKAPLNKLILSYLTHHGYAKTARALSSQYQKREENGSFGTPSGLSAGGDVEMADAASLPSSSRGSPVGELDNGIELRTYIVQSVAHGNIDTAIHAMKTHHPSVILAEEGLVHFKLQCRKFIELILKASDMKKRMAGGPTDGVHSRHQDGISTDGEHAVDGENGGSMDVDDDALSVAMPPISAASNGFTTARSPSIGRNNFRRPRPAPDSAAVAAYEAALTEALSYGQMLQKEYEKDGRDEVKKLFKRTFSVVAFEDPLAAGGDVAEVASPAARVALANEVNQAILKSLGRPARPPLETLYRRAAASIMQLGLIGVGSAAFADIQKELLEP